MNMIRRAKQQAAQEAASAVTRKHRGADEDSTEARVEERELVWFGEFVDPEETKPFKFCKGEKQALSNDERIRFIRTPYERGFTEYIYEGTVKVMKRPPPPSATSNSSSSSSSPPRSSMDLTDPRGTVRDGQGILRYAMGEMYEGGWRHGKRHGFGFFSTPLKYMYTGDWVEDTLAGKGYETFPCGVSIDCKNYSKGLPDGPGVFLYAPKTSLYRYEGEFKDGRRHGKGVVFYENGDTYSGSWDQGQRHGRGVTTQFIDGKEKQFETEWDQGILVKKPTLIEKTKRLKKPKTFIPFTTQGNLVAADLTKWSVKDDVSDLPLEHFLRIKLGFELLDRHATGSLSTIELSAIWGQGSKGMLEKLDTDGNGTVELDEIFAAWYPNVPPHNILRFMQQDIHPRNLLRYRGALCKVLDTEGCGYMQVVGIRSVEDVRDIPLSLKHLEEAGYKIGNEKFTTAMYDAARQLCDPPHFSEVLETWYPNISRAALERYELEKIPQTELFAIRESFFRLSNKEVELRIEAFEKAQERYQTFLYRKFLLEKRDNQNQRSSAQEDENPPEEEEDLPEEVLFTDPIETAMVDGFFRDSPFWLLGSSICLSLRLLKEIDKFDSKIGGSVSLQQILRFCYPNVLCRRTQEALIGRKRGTASSSTTTACQCQICTII